MSVEHVRARNNRIAFDSDIADLAALPASALNARTLIDEARRRTGLTDFGDADFEEPLRRLLRVVHEEADLSRFGRLATRWDVVRFLSNLLRLRYEETRTPAILDLPIEKPIFITGLPRSGTTFLAHLLAEDHANLLPRVWQVIFPYQRLNARLPGDWRADPLNGSCECSGCSRRSLRAFTASGHFRLRNARRSPRMYSPACVSTRPISFRVTAAGLMPRVTLNPTSFTSAFCSISNFKQCAERAGS